MRLLFLSKFLIDHTSLPYVYLLPFFLQFLSDFSLSFSVVRLLFICFSKPLISYSLSSFLHRLLLFLCSILWTFSILHILSCVILYCSLFSLPFHLILRSIVCCLCWLLHFSSFCRLFMILTVEPVIPTWFYISACLDRQTFLGRWFLYPSLPE